MEVTAGNHKLYENHFCLNEALFRKFHSVMKTYSDKLEKEADVVIRIEREDDSFYETLNIDTILDDENTEGKSISFLSMEIIENTSETNNKSTLRKNRKALIEFVKDGKDVFIRVTTSHQSRDWCFLLVDELDSQIQRITKGKSYPSFPTRLLDTVFGVVLFGVYLGWYALDRQREVINTDELLLKGTEEKINFLVEITADASNSNTSTILPSMIFFMLFIIFMSEFKPIHRLLRIANLSVFYWGDMIAKHDSTLQKRSRIKWGVIVAFIVSVVASVVASRLI